MRKDGGMDESHKQEENLKNKTKQEKLRVVYIRSGQQNREAQLEAAVLIAVQYYYKRDTDAHTHTHTHTRMHIQYTQQ